MAPSEATLIACPSSAMSNVVLSCCSSISISSSSIRSPSCSPSFSVNIVLFASRKCHTGAVVFCFLKAGVMCWLVSLLTSANPTSQLVHSEHHTMTATRSQRMAKSPSKTKTRNAMSQRRLQAMIEKGQKMDVGLGNSEASQLDHSDLRPEKERAALLLWVLSN